MSTGNERCADGNGGCALRGGRPVCIVRSSAMGFRKAPLCRLFNSAPQGCAVDPLHAAGIAVGKHRASMIAFAMPPQPSLALRYNWDLSGGDMPGMPVNIGSDPSLCRALCNRTAGCTAFSYGVPNCGGLGATALCWLKLVFTKWSPSGCRVSGDMAVLSAFPAYKAAPAAAPAPQASFDVGAARPVRGFPSCSSTYLKGYEICRGSTGEKAVAIAASETDPAAACAAVCCAESATCGAWVTAVNAGPRTCYLKPRGCATAVAGQSPLTLASPITYATATDPWFFGLVGGFINGLGPQPLPAATQQTISISRPYPACTWSAPRLNTFSGPCANGFDGGPICEMHDNFTDAQAACIARDSCFALTSSSGGVAPWQLRGGEEPGDASTMQETSFFITNRAACRPATSPFSSLGGPLLNFASDGRAIYAAAGHTLPVSVFGAGAANANKSALADFSGVFAAVLGYDTAVGPRGAGSCVSFEFSIASPSWRAHPGACRASGTATDAVAHLYLAFLWPRLLVRTRPPSRGLGHAPLTTGRAPTPSLFKRARAVRAVPGLARPHPTRAEQGQPVCGLETPGDAILAAGSRVVSARE